MILRRLFLIAAAAAAIAASAASAVIAAAFAVYALLKPELGPAGAAASLAAILAVFAGIIGLAAAGAGRSRAARKTERDPIALAERLIEMVQEKPWAAGIVAAVVCLMALRSPTVIEAVARAFFDSRPSSRRRRPKESA